jgi:hypothetical protein
MNSLEYYLDKLFLIKSLNNGETISTTSFTIVNKNEWLTSIWRMANGENRIETVDFLKSFIESAVNDFPTKEMYIAIEDSIVGLETLKFTYSDDEYIIAKLNELICYVTGLINIDDGKLDYIYKYNQEIENENIIYQPKKIKHMNDMITLDEFLKEPINKYNFCNKSNIIAKYYQNIYINNIWPQKYNITNIKTHKY